MDLINYALDLLLYTYVTLFSHRLYSSAVYDNDFEEYSQSEIQRKPVDDLLLQMKAMNIDKVVNFPFPTPPDIVQLKSAEKRLTILGALEPPSKKQEGSRTWTFI